jgi:hypothetical protein
MKTKTPADKKKPAAAEPILVFISHGREPCGHCHADLAKGAFIVFKNEKPACHKCGGLSGLVFLPSGDPALTRRATALSPVKYLVLQFSRARRRNERQGILVTEEILAQARRECEADASAREQKRQASAARREIQDQKYLAAFAARIRELYPSAIPGVENEIAAHACRKWSGRVGRAAFAKALEPRAIHLAVLAHIRHRLTRYEDHLIQGRSREESRQLVAARIESLADSWRRPHP